MGESFRCTAIQTALQTDALRKITEVYARAPRRFQVSPRGAARGTASQCESLAFEAPTPAVPPERGELGRSLE